MHGLLEQDHITPDDTIKGCLHLDRLELYDDLKIVKGLKHKYCLKV